MQHPASSITITAPQYSYPSSLTHFRIPFSNASTGKVTPATLMYNLPHRRPATLLPSAERLRQQHPATADEQPRKPLFARRACRDAACLEFPRFASKETKTPSLHFQNTRKQF
jgi:hypothetical protein